LEALGPNDPTTVGNYRLAAVLGTGGMGRVYLAFSPSGRRVAIKVIRPDLVQESHIRSRFAREVAASRAVSGFFAAGVIDADVDANPPWLATAYVPGPSLVAAVREAGALPVPSVRALGAALAEALSAVHAAGLIHRDLKPANVLLAPDGPRLIDFGISSLGDSGTLTHAGAMMGSPGYMSPEQIRGQTIGTPTDVFAFGAVLAFTSTGAGPFGTGTVPTLLYRSVHAAPDLEGVPAELRPLLTACLDKDPARRPDLPTILRELTGGQAAADMFPPGWLDAAFAQSPMPVAPMPGAIGPTPTPIGTTPVPMDPAISPVPAAPGGYATADAATRRQGFPSTPPPIAAWPTVHQTPSDPGSFGSGSPAGSAAPVGYAEPGAAPQGRPAPEQRPRRAGPSRRGLLIGALGAVGLAAGGTAAWQLLDDKNDDGGKGDVPVASQLWRVATTGTVLSRSAIAGSLVYAASNDGTLYALNTASGSVAWKHTTGGALGSAPLALGGVVYLGGDDTYLYAFDAATGKVRWQFQTLGIVHSPVGGGGVVYVGSADTHLYAVDAVSGARRWAFQAENDTHSPALAGESVYVGSSDTNLYAVDAASGAKRWAYTTAGAVSGIPAVMGGIVYFGSTDGFLYAVDTNTGKLVWKFEGVSAGAGPTIANGTIYMGGRAKNLFALRATDGQVQWTFQAAGDLNAPAVAGGTVYVGSGDANLYAVDGATGKERWHFTGGGGLHTVAISNSTAFVGSDDNGLYAVRV